MFGTNNNQQYNPVQYQQPGAIAQQNEKKSKTLKKAGTILGWIGAPLWLIIFLEIDMVMFLLALLVAVSMTLLSIKSFEPHSKVLSIAMLAFSVFTLNVFNITAGILFLCAKKAE